MKDLTIVTLVCVICATLIAIIHDREFVFPVLAIISGAAGLGTLIGTAKGSERIMILRELNVKKGD